MSLLHLNSQARLDNGIRIASDVEASMTNGIFILFTGLGVAKIELLSDQDEKLVGCVF